MVTEKEQEQVDPWELESGLPNDVDAFMAHCRFGKREEYMDKIEVAVDIGDDSTGLMFLFDLVSPEGEILGQQGYSVGSGWKASDDGASISHPTRKNVVVSSRYGQLQHRAVKEIEVDMNKYGKPLVAASWEGLGWHWMLEEHETLKQVEGGGREKKQGLMPTAFVGVNEAIRGGKAPAAAPAQAPAAEEAAIEVDPKLELKLKELAQSNSYKDFIKEAVKVPAVVDNDDLMSSVMDDSPAGFFATHQ